MERSNLDGSQSAQSSGTREVAALFGAAAAETILASGPRAALNRSDTWTQDSTMPFRPSALASRGSSTHGLLAGFRLPGG